MKRQDELKLCLYEIMSTAVYVFLVLKGTFGNDVIKKWKRHPYGTERVTRPIDKKSVVFCYHTMTR